MKNYFKKFSIMFVMLLVVIGVGAIHNGTTANAATVGEQLAQPEEGWKRYDDTDKNISYVGQWSLWSGSADIWTNTTTHWSQSANSVCKFNFTGNKIRIITELYNDHSRNINVKIDGNSLGSFSERNSTQKGKTISYENMNLSSGEHCIELTNLEAYQFIIDGIDLDKNGELKSYNPNIAIIASNISLNKVTDNLTVEQTDLLTATTTPSAVVVNWTSSDSNIATVDSNGKVTAVKEGQATITATTTDGSNLSASCIVIVTAKGTIPNPPQNPDSEYIVNIAHAKGDNTNNASGEVSIIYMGVAEAQLSVVKTADVSSVYVGDNFTYTIVVTNTSSKLAKAVVIKDSAPNHIQFVVNGITTTQGTVDSSSNSSNVVVNIGDIPPLGTVTIKIPATVIL